MAVSAIALSVSAAVNSFGVTGCMHWDKTDSPNFTDLETLPIHTRLIICINLCKKKKKKCNQCKQTTAPTTNAGKHRLGRTHLSLYVMSTLGNIGLIHISQYGHTLVGKSGQKYKERDFNTGRRVAEQELTD